MKVKVVAVLKVIWFYIMVAIHTVTAACRESNCTLEYESRMVKEGLESSYVLRPEVQECRNRETSQRRPTDVCRNESVSPWSIYWFGAYRRVLIVSPELAIDI